MNSVAKLKDGREFEIPCVKWHPPVHRSDGSSQLAGLWVLEDDVINAVLAIVGEALTRHKAMSMIECAEAYVQVYLDNEDHEPWKHYGLLLKTIIPGPVASCPHTLGFNCDY